MLTSHVVLGGLQRMKGKLLLRRNSKVFRLRRNISAPPHFLCPTVNFKVYLLT